MMAMSKDNNPPTPKANRFVRVAIVLLVVAALAAYVATGIYVVEPDERGVVRRFGKIVEPAAMPGLHFAWPAPFGQVDTPKTTESKRVVVGQDPETRAAIAAGDLVARSESLATDVFTGDVNIVKTTLIATYLITKPELYLSATANPQRLIENVIQSVMVETLGGMTIDAALTEGKAVVENVVLQRAQQMLDQYACGITLQNVTLESIEPPFAINDAFKDVASAKKDRERGIDEARGFGDTIVRRARGSAAEILASARGQRDIRISQARGEASRFSALLTEYQKAPDITRTRLVMDTLTEIMGKVRIFILPKEKDGPPMRLTIYSD